MYTYVCVCVCVCVYPLIAKPLGSGARLRETPRQISKQTLSGSQDRHACIFRKAPHHHRLEGNPTSLVLLQKKKKM